MEDANSETHCVLVADSDVLERHAIADYLRNCGYVVIEATSSEEVMTVIEAGPLQVHAILCDAQLSGSTSAFELRTWLRRHNPDIKVAMAATLEKTAAAAADLCDEGPHLARPYDPQMVVDYIRRMLGSGNGSVDPKK